MVWHSYHHAQIEEKHFQAQGLTESLANQLVLVAECILKLNDSQTKIIVGQIIACIGVRVGDISQRFAHDAKASEVACLALDLLILL
jgi:hypothetical protein